MALGFNLAFVSLVPVIEDLNLHPLISRVAFERGADAHAVNAARLGLDPFERSAVPMKEVTFGPLRMTSDPLISCFRGLCAEKKSRGRQYPGSFSDFCWQSSKKLNSNCGVDSSLYSLPERSPLRPPEKLRHHWSMNYAN